MRRGSQRWARQSKHLMAPGTHGEFTCCLKQWVHLASRLDDFLGRREWRVIRHQVPPAHLVKTSRPGPAHRLHRSISGTTSLCPASSPNATSFHIGSFAAQLQGSSPFPPSKQNSSTSPSCLPCPAGLSIPPLPLCVHTFNLLH